ncbi:MAG: UDP-N-acetylmuramate dehydrogenase [Treponema sp.]|nr:UDP-N-acetylmuramate dehydrogenase [Treponema sp.]
MNDIKKLIEKCLIENPCEADIRYNEPMSEHTTFKTGGAADCWLRPDGEGFTSFCAALLNRARSSGIPVFVLGGGANVVVSDKGIRGIVLDMGRWTGESVWALCAGEDEFIIKSGTTIDEAVDYAAAEGLSGLEFLAGMPGTVGGAVWMNARCYGGEMSDVLNWVEVIINDNTQLNGAQRKDESDSLDSFDFSIKRIYVNDKSGFGYKKSPFQDMDCVILSASFNLKKGDKEKILVEMDKYREDRYNKGHYSFPCAGSVFKNNHVFGKPSGQIIDELGLKGSKRGAAQVAPFHGNIIINLGGAKAGDIKGLADEIAAKVKKETGFVMEPEILFIGEWD